MTMSTQAAAIVETDLPCVGCGYNLRTRPLDGTCPECGQSVSYTLQFPRLSRSAPRWLTSLVNSVTVLLAAFGFAVACFWIDRRRDEPLPVLLGTTAWALAWFAVWLLTRPEPGVRRRSAVRWRAWALRFFATPPYVTAFATPVLLREFELWGAVIAGACMFCVVPATFLYYDHLAEAAHRLPSRRLEWQAAAVCWLLPPAVLTSMAGMVALGRWPQSAGQVLTSFPLVGLGGVRDLYTVSQILLARASLVDPLPLTVGPAAVMTVWAVAVLVQFRLAFAAAGRAARSAVGTPAAGAVSTGVLPPGANLRGQSSAPATGGGE